MKKIILNLLLLLFAISLFAQQTPTIKFYMNNGSYKKFNITDITDIGIIKSQVSTTITVFNKVQSLNLSFDSHTLKQILFISDQQIQIILDSKTNTYNLSDIDSIVAQSKPAPVINSINPIAGKTGDIITISGLNFGSIEGSVKFTGSSATIISSWTDTEIKVQIPKYASTGKVSVSAAGQQSNEVDFSVIPQITSINPIAANPAEELTISGTGFGGTQGTSFVTFNGLKATQYSNWGTTEIKVTVPDGATSGKLSATVETQKSNEVDYSIKPHISEILPLSANIGDEITISGTGFGKLQSNSTVTIGGVNVSEYSFWSETQIKIKVPVMTSGGKLYVTVGGLKSNEVDFTLIPQITSINPSSAKIGIEISISGIGFGSSRGTSFVLFGAATATDFTSWSETLIKVKVPLDAITGKVSVTVNSIKSNEVDFTLIPSVIYKTVTIGSQTWMKNNLDVDHYQNGDAIPQVTDFTMWSNLTTGAWCYYLNNENYDIYFGKLYNWYALNDPRGIAPEGWRIPNDADWFNLEKTIGMSQTEAQKTGWRGTNEGNKLKQEGTDNWSSPNGNTNSTGFTALGGGYRTPDGFFNILKDYGGFWTITDNDFLTAWARTLKFSNSNIERMQYDKKYGFSVRCIMVK
jgi:uncharacterized protein (TIGR02145 family)